ncbi:unnamed protein product [Tuber aestivum]|uniref:Uncharacterized protein n=1 Tax=Tuber aestivum TaxID=59557 RepID=A0A292PRI3_9PEZI|nr:unnamed protein product [Tuber aestivum]
MTTEGVSHGRGGTGNIGPDDTTYVDGEIRREGDPTATGGAYSSGRGGAGNIGSPHQHPVRASMDEEVVPNVAKVGGHDGEPFHSGRGGEGNVRLPEGTGKKGGAAGGSKGLMERIMKFWGRK